MRCIRTAVLALAAVAIVMNHSALAQEANRESTTRLPEGTDLGAYIWDSPEMRAMSRRNAIELADKQLWGLSDGEGATWPYVGGGRIGHEICEPLTELMPAREVYFERIASKLRLSEQQKVQLEADCDIWSAGYKSGQMDAMSDQWDLSR